MRSGWGRLGKRSDNHWHVKLNFGRKLSLTVTCHAHVTVKLYFLSFFGIYFLQIGCPQTTLSSQSFKEMIWNNIIRFNQKASLGRKLWDTLPKPIAKLYIYGITEKGKKTHSHLFNSELEVLTERISGAPASVTLKSISLIPFHNSQAGVISDGSHFKVVLRVSTKLRNDSEKDFPNVVILKLNLLKID